MEFNRIQRLPPYTLGVVTQLMNEARQKGEDIINLGMGNPDLPTPPHIVDKLTEAAEKAKNHRYSVSRGIPKLRQAICKWYERRYKVKLDFDEEAIATIGAKEGFSHLMFAACSPGDVVLVQSPTYPIHLFAPVIAGADVRAVRYDLESDFFENLQKAYDSVWPKPKMLILSFPNNPTGQCVDFKFFEKVVVFAKKHSIGVVHDFAYADLYFGQEAPPSFLQVKGAKDIGVEIYSLSKSYNMPGWRVGFCAGNRKMIAALKRLKSYLDYGMFQPIQIAATVALDGPQQCVQEIGDIYRARRDVLCEGLTRAGWEIPKPAATMFVWAKIPENFVKKDSLAFSKFLLKEAGVAVSPGIGFGEFGEGFVRFALVENEKRIRQAVRGIKGALQGIS